MSDAIKPTGIVDPGAQARKGDFSEIPVLDLQPLFGSDAAAKHELARALRRACSEVGFFYVKNHGVPPRLREAMLEQTQLFFDMPQATKLGYDIGRINRHRGFVPVGALTAGPEEAPDLQEGYEIALELPDDDPDYLAGSKLFGPNVWPAELPQFQAQVYAYFEAVLALGRKLFGAFALALELPEDYFDRELSKPIAQLRLLYYPPGGDTPDSQKGIGAHTDYECFTVLWQTAPGLQVQNRANEWIEAPPIEDAFLVNIGDMLMRWTNDLFRSTPHRVVSPQTNARYSFPFFFAADYDTVVRCLDTCVGPDNAARYPPTKFGYWIENMHAYSYVYRHAERGKLPKPELS